MWYSVQKLNDKREVMQVNWIGLRAVSFKFLGLDIEQRGNAGKAAISTWGALNSRRLPSCHLPVMWPQLAPIRRKAYVNSPLIFS
jgi:hypothetical protein